MKPPLRIVTALALLGSAAGLSAATLVASLPLPTTLADFFQPGTQPNTVFQTVLDSSNCTTCHSGFDPDSEPYERWAASMMAQSTRDPVFHAALAIANQDAANSGEMCLRCHAPAAWLHGRSTPSDGSALDSSQGDFDGVSCSVCHRLVDPFFELGVNPRVDKRILDHLAAVPFSIGGGQMVVDPNDNRRGPFWLGPNFYYHFWLESPFHRESLLCATCHDVSNPVFTRQLDGTYALDTTNTPHPTQDKLDQFPVERTYSEWSKSVFAQAEIDMGGRFGGNKPEVSTCQDCHMPDTTGTACNPVIGGEYRTDLPRHDFNGANSWVLRSVRSLYPDSETGLSAASVAAAGVRTQDMLSKAADLAAYVRGTQLVARVVNHTGHKLPTGYPEGRRMWLNVRFFAPADVLVAEHGAYDASTATLTTSDTRVYEAKLGLDAAMSGQTGVPAGESFHFVLNNVLLKDNRVPPRGFTNAGFEAVQAKPVAASYAEQHHWDEATYPIPPGAVRAEVRLLHQTSTREYMEFLLAANTTNGAGQQAYDQWVLHGRSAPVTMQTALVDLLSGPCPPSVAYGLAKLSSLQERPILESLGSPTLSTNTLELRVRDAIPNTFGALYQSVNSGSQSTLGGTLLLSAPIVRVTNFPLDATGSATIPIPVLPGMVGTALHYQAIFRDGASPQPYGLTQGLFVQFCP